MFYLGFCCGAIAMTIIAIVAYEGFVAGMRDELRKADDLLSRIEDKIDGRQA